MHPDKNMISKSAAATAEEHPIEIPQSKPSPELTAFLELIGRALAQQWIDENGHDTGCR
jgi:hypothetical protein